MLTHVCFWEALGLLGRQLVKVKELCQNYSDLVFCVLHFYIFGTCLWQIQPYIVGHWVRETPCTFLSQKSTTSVVILSHISSHETQNWICKTGIHQAENIYVVLLSVSGSIIWWIRNVVSFRLILYVSLWLKSLFPLPPKISLSKSDSSRNYQVPLYLSNNSHVLHTEESHSRYC